MHDHNTPPSHRARAKSPLTRLVCQHCGQEFKPKRGTTGFFCSQTCYWAWRRKTGLLGFTRAENSAFSKFRTRLGREQNERQRQAFLHPELLEEAATADDRLWAERGRYWQGEADEAACEKAIVPLQERKALVLAGHGVRLRIDHGTLLVRHGFTHYPQELREERFFPGDYRLPSRIILLSADGSISLDVARWLSEQHVPLVILDYRGKVLSVLGVETTAADLSLRRAQLEALTNGAGLRLACALIEQKLEACLVTLAAMPKSGEREAAVEAVRSCLSRLREKRPGSADEIRWVEALAAVAYFAAWQGLRLNWKSTGRQPIPPEWRRVGPRQDLLRHRNRHAHHPVNAMLNYGYAVLESQVRIAIAAAGLDPTIGYLHSNQPGRQTLVYDLMEPYRPEVDWKVREFIRTAVFGPKDFVVNSKGMCRLHPELAKLVASTSFDLGASFDMCNVVEILTSG